MPDQGLGEHSVMLGDGARKGRTDRVLGLHSECPWQSFSSVSAEGPLSRWLDLTFSPHKSQKAPSVQGALASPALPPPGPEGLETTRMRWGGAARLSLEGTGLYSRDSHLEGLGDFRAWALIGKGVTSKGKTADSRAAPSHTTELQRHGGGPIHPREAAPSAHIRNPFYRKENGLGWAGQSRSVLPAPSP